MKPSPSARRTLAALAALAGGGLVCVSCGGDPPFLGNNNHARLEGEAMGLGLADNALLRKEVPATWLYRAGALEIGVASISRWSVDSVGLDLMMEVHNAGEATVCQIFPQDIQLTVGGEPVGQPRLGSFFGSVGVFEDRQSSRCLAPEESGYVVASFSEEEAPPYDDVDGVQLGSSGNLVNPINPAPDLVPRAYSLSPYPDVPDWSELVVDVDNEGEGSAAIRWVSDSAWILFDDQGVPLTWGFLYGPSEGDPSTRSVSPGDSVRLFDPLCTCNVFEGSGSQVEVRIDFVDSAYPG